MPVLLCILDGWGHSTAEHNNAIHSADTPYWDYLIKTHPNCKIATSGNSVGLPEGQMGNSEVGHMTIGAGRIIKHALVRINEELPKIQHNNNFNDFLLKLKKNNSKCHLVGLLSPGGVHSHIEHICHLNQILEKQNIEVALHAFLDGRDTPPQSAMKYISTLTPSTICGRYYAMDRDNNLDRTRKAYELVMFAKSKKQFASAKQAITHYYSEEITDEFILPTAIGDYSGVKPGDGILMCNFRADRTKQLLAMLKEHTNLPSAIPFELLGIIDYSRELKIKSIFPTINIANTLGAIISKNNMKQLRIAETEKYAHVTFFFNGGYEKAYPNEARILIPSPKVATYDLKPEMSAFEITNRLENILTKNEFDLIVLNFANPDMVGHSGNLSATIKAIETIDQCLNKIIPLTLRKNIDTIITADHGNAETMYDQSSGSIHTFHTTNSVPLIFTSDKKALVRDGNLSDIAPSILELLKLPRPDDMTGRSLLTVSC